MLTLLLIMGDAVEVMLCFAFVLLSFSLSLSLSFTKKVQLHQVRQWARIVSSAPTATGAAARWRVRPRPSPPLFFEHVEWKSLRRGTLGRDDDVTK